MNFVQQCEVACCDSEFPTVQKHGGHEPGFSDLEPLLSAYCFLAGSRGISSSYNAYMYIYTKFPHSILAPSKHRVQVFGLFLKRGYHGLGLRVQGSKALHMKLRLPGHT